MTDTDSVLFKCETEDIYQDILYDDVFMNKMDTGNLRVPELINNGIEYNNYDMRNSLNLMKCEENNGRNLWTIKQFVGLKSKMYAYEKYKAFENEKKQDNRAKGLSKTISKTLNFDEYKDVLIQEGIRDFNITNFRTYNQQLYTVEQNKIGLNCYDDKRYLADSIHSLPFGY